MSAEPTEPDAEPGTPHPRLASRFVGHEAAEAALASALESGRLHHAWLITGPKGVGKATLAYRFARRLLGAPHAGPRALDADPDHPIARRIAALSHPDLRIIRRGLNEKGRSRAEITVEEARALGGFFALKPAEGGFRVAVIDAADDLNRNAANAILKTLEEPPPRTVLLLVSHAPGGLLPTIRSRCRRLALKRLPDAAVVEALGGDADASLLRLAEGRPGRAIALRAVGVTAFAQAFEDALRTAERGGPSRLLQLAFDREGPDASQRLGLFLELSRAFARDAARVATGVTPEAAPALHDDLIARLAKPGSAARWAEAHGRLSAMAAEADALSLDPQHAYARAATILADAARGA